jgi:hypothetical protein
MLGRTIVDADAEIGAAHVAVIGYDFWQRRFGGSPVVLGRRIELGNESFSIIGVMPRGFGFPRGAEKFNRILSHQSQFFRNSIPLMLPNGP